MNNPFLSAVLRKVEEAIAKLRGEENEPCSTSQARTRVVLIEAGEELRNAIQNLQANMETVSAANQENSIALVASQARMYGMQVHSSANASGMETASASGNSGQAGSNATGIPVFEKRAVRLHRDCIPAVNLQRWESIPIPEQLKLQYGENAPRAAKVKATKDIRASVEENGPEPAQSEPEKRRAKRRRKQNKDRRLQEQLDIVHNFFMQMDAEEPQISESTLQPDSE